MFCANAADEAKRIAARRVFARGGNRVPRLPTLVVHHGQVIRIARLVAGVDHRWRGAAAFRPAIANGRGVRLHSAGHGDAHHLVWRVASHGPRGAAADGRRKNRPSPYRRAASLARLGRAFDRFRAAGAWAVGQGSSLTFCVEYSPFGLLAPSKTARRDLQNDRHARPFVIDHRRSSAAPILRRILGKFENGRFEVFARASRTACGTTTYGIIDTEEDRHW